VNMAGLPSSEWLKNLPNKDRDSLVCLAKCLEQAERYDDMAICMKEVTNFEKELSNEERNLLSVANKNVVGSRRNSFRVLLSRINRTQDAEKQALTKEYLEKLQTELNDICTGVLDLIKDKLLPNCSNAEGKVFYHKMTGDYYRYKAENAKGDNHADVVNASLAAYDEATKIATENLSSTHPIRLGLALNYSVFYYEIMNSPDKACQLAKKAFDDAVTDVDSANEDSYKDSTLIMQLLRDNLALWTSEPDETENNEGDQ